MGRDFPTTWVLAAALAMVTHACTRPQMPSSAQAPKLVVEEALHDFGVVDQGTKVTHTYRLRNAGGLDLAIDNVRTSCGCTAVASSPRSVPPGRDGTIDVVFDTANAFGPQGRSISVYSNDPSQPVTTLTLRGRVNADVAADPPSLYVGHLSRGQTAAVDARIVGNAAAEIRAVESAGKVIGATVEAPPDAKGKRLRVVIKQDAPLGKFEAQVAIHTSSSQRPSLTIQVSGSVDGDVVVSPGEVNFGTTPARGKASRVIGVQNHGKQPVHITAAHLDPAIGTTTVMVVRQGEEYRVTVTLNEGLHPGKIAGTLEVDTDHPEQARIAVPFSGRVVERS